MAQLKVRRVYHAVVLLALILRSLTEIQFPQLDSDYAAQIQSGVHAVNGNGFSIKTVSCNANQLTVESKPLTMWPNGYPILISTFYFITGDPIVAQICIQVLAVVLYVLGFVYLFKTLDISIKVRIVFFLFLAFSPTPFFYLGTSDLLNASLFLWTSTLFIAYFHDNLFWKAVLLISILSFLAAIIRFASIPALVIFPSVFFMLFLIYRRKELLKMSFFIGFVSVSLTVLFYSIFPIAKGRTDFVDNLIHGNFYFEHIKWFDPFPIKSFIFSRPIEFHLPGSPLLIKVYRYAITFVSFAFFLAVLWNFIKKLSLKRLASNNQQFLSFVLVFLVTLVVIAGFIALQSLTIPPESNSFGPKWMPPIWTFVYATRYFVYIMVLIQIAVVIWLSDVVKRKVGFSWLKSVPGFVLGSSVLTGIIFWLYYNYNFFGPNGNGSGSMWVTNKEEIFISYYLDDIQKKNPERKVFFFNDLTDGYNGTLSSYFSFNYGVCYSEIISGNCMPGGNEDVFVFLSAKNLTSAERKFLHSRANSIRLCFPNGYLLKL